MDTARFEELKKKIFDERLSDEEANELGRMFPEQGGEQHQTAEEYQAEARTDRRSGGRAELAGEASPGRGPGTDDRPETLKDDADSRPEPESDDAAGTRAPLGGTVETVEQDE